ncbi:hypothetical protein MNEG_16671 [Monoraphidium neglectum]|uniref:Uncharacterized protein n=1 Tax=Monoraphidium neglectum TaxID=145388 RepID=A0A0D2K573_9CHLO|nr:hypothetical protein MNEG_16671 [Monoraphidium neglectum]KIY91293.1 hypothetical protein MNEG_16671 [Monoraphidium neglectum]|eukprot:XP_013890313.1 hypothetical protein MNEG_16671 [Monoraphidium neglectum]
MRAAQSEVRRERLSAAAARRERESALRALKAAQAALEEAEGQLPQLRVEIELVTKDKVAAGDTAGALGGEIAVLKKEVDLKIAAFMEEESCGKDKAALYGLLRQEVR